MTPSTPNSWTRTYRRRVTRLARELMWTLQDIAYWDANGWPPRAVRQVHEAKAASIAEAARQAAVQAALGHPARVAA